MEVNYPFPWHAIYTPLERALRPQSDKTSTGSVPAEQYQNDAVCHTGTVRLLEKYSSRTPGQLLLHKQWAICWENFI